jgi:hypothetical protein
MKFYAVLALIAAATAAVTPAADPVAEPMDIEQQGEAEAAPAVEADGADADHWGWPKYPKECKPGRYSCYPNKKAIRVCDWSGHWTVSIPFFSPRHT